MLEDQNNNMSGGEPENGGFAPNSGNTENGGSQDQNNTYEAGQSGQNDQYGAVPDGSNQFSQPWSDPTYKTPYENPDGIYSPTYHDPSSYNSQFAAAPEPAPKKVKKPRKPASPFVRALCIVLVAVLISSAISLTGTYFMINSMKGSGSTTNSEVVLGSSGSAESTASTETTTDNSSSGAMTSSQIYDLACKQVVGVNTAVTTTNVFGQATSSAVSGSGFVISEDGYILTNYHVISYAVEYGYALTVIFYDGTTYDATVVGYEEDNDIAVIKIDATGLSPVTLGSSSDMTVGEQIYTVGNPLGELTYTMTSGIVSALDREIQTDESTTINMFQIDAAVNAGNSGGPVYDSNGQVIGVVSAKYSSTGVEGLGFAIPINDAVDIATQLIENGYVTGKAYLGVNVVDISDEAAQYYSIPEGAYVYSVVDGSCAAAAGVQAGDVITAVDGTTVTNVETLKAALKSYSAGDTATITLSRSGQEMTVQVTFDENTTSQSSGSSSQSSGSSGSTQQLPQQNQSGSSSQQAS